MSLGEEIEKAATARAEMQRQQRERTLEYQKLVQETAAALQRFGDEVVQECRRRNLRMAGEFDVHTEETFFSGRKYRFEMTTRGWLLGGIFVDERGKFFEIEVSEPWPFNRLSGANRERYQRDKSKALGEHNVEKSVRVVGPLRTYLRDGRLCYVTGYIDNDSSSHSDLMEAIAVGLIS